MAANPIVLQLQFKGLDPVNWFKEFGSEATITLQDDTNGTINWSSQSANMKTVPTSFDCVYSSQLGSTVLGSVNGSFSIPKFKSQKLKASKPNSISKPNRLRPQQTNSTATKTSKRRQFPKALTSQTSPKSSTLYDHMQPTKPSSLSPRDANNLRFKRLAKCIAESPDLQKIKEEFDSEYSRFIELEKLLRSKTEEFRKAARIHAQAPEPESKAQAEQVLRHLYLENHKEFVKLRQEYQELGTKLQDLKQSLLSCDGVGKRT